MELQMLAHLRILCVDVHRSGDEEGVVAAGDGFVKAAFFVQVGAEDLQGSERLQVLEVGVLPRVICDSESKQSLALLNKNFVGNTQERKEPARPLTLSGRQHKEEDEQWM